MLRGVLCSYHKSKLLRVTVRIYYSPSLIAKVFACVRRSYDRETVVPCLLYDAVVRTARNRTLPLIIDS